VIQYFDIYIIVHFDIYNRCCCWCKWCRDSRFYICLDSTIGVDILAGGLLTLEWVREITETSAVSNFDTETSAVSNADRK